MIESRVEAVLIGKIKPLGQRQAPSGIDKRPIERPIVFDELGFQGDEQGDCQAHGGLEKAIHHYPFDHYPKWAALFDQEKSPIYQGPDLSLPGAFGENISSSGLVEEDVCLGDVFELGTGIVQISQGRQPCWKLNERFGVKTMARRVQNTGMTGWYYRVLKPGEVQAGHRLLLLERPGVDWPLSRVTKLLYEKTSDFEALEGLLMLPFLAESWRLLVERRLKRRAVEDWTKRLEG